MDSDDELFAEAPADNEEPERKKRRKKRKRGRILTVEDIPRKVREEFRTDQKVNVQLSGETGRIQMKHNTVICGLIQTQVE